MISRVLLLLLVVATPALKAAAQSLDIQQHRFTADVQILTAADFLPRDVLRSLERTHAPLPDPVAVGRINNVTYLYRDNGRALFATTEAQDWKKMSQDNSWAIACAKDAMEDFVTCRLTRKDLAIVVRDSGYVAVVIGRNHYPGTSIAVRIDQDTPLTIAAPGFGRSEAHEVVQRVTAGHSVTTRYQEWPYRANIDRTIDLYGFNEALQFLNWVVSRYR